MNKEIFESAADAILRGDPEKAAEVARKGLGEGIDPLTLISDGFVPGINKVGDMFECGQLFLPELVKAANAMQRATDIVNAAIPEGEGQTRGRIIIGTVEGDVHDIGKTIVVSLMKANGFEVMDLGRDVSTDRFVEAAEQFNADIIGTSALLTTTMEGQRRLEYKLKETGLKKRFKTMVGGAPITQRWAKRIGADAFAENASEAVKQAKALLET
ncbi:MAG: dimethylamine corrinoid protein 3 [Deltaproteobacteria bacterium]|nr:MAG: dimethylamine corrinoid protein 3 [Deltaproteobacteria bacterium]RUA01252.1 MAG: dimethylamine corrinoid protein 3 [Deltaproteobacteria bacterium]